MEISFQQYEQIQRYFDNGMSNVEKEQFLMEVSKNAALKESMDLEKQLRFGPALEDLYIHSLVENAGKKWEQNEKKKPIVPIVSLKRKSLINTIIAIAACISIIVTSILIGLSYRGIKKSNNAISNVVPKSESDTATKSNDIKNTESFAHLDSNIKEKPSLNDHFKKYYKKDKAPENIPEMYSGLFNGYDNNDYPNLQNFDPNKNRTRSISKDTITEIIRYYKGISFIETGNYKKAQRELQWVIDSAKNKTLNQKAQWYKALVFLKNGSNLEAIKLLTKLSIDEKAMFHKKAKKLLSDLK